jgi:hypothetical protein
MTDISISSGDANDIAAIMPIMNSAFDPKYGEAWTAAQCLSLLATCPKPADYWRSKAAKRRICPHPLGL